MINSISCRHISFPFHALSGSFFARGCSLLVFVKTVYQHGGAMEFDLFLS